MKSYYTINIKKIEIKNSYTKIFTSSTKIAV